MSKRKETSTNSINRELLNNFCGVNYAMDLIGGRWKTMILYKLGHRPLRFTEIRQILPNITDRMLTLQLRELERDGLVVRTVYADVPARVEYSLSDSGVTLSPIWKNLEQWGLEHRVRHNTGKDFSPVTSVADPSGPEPTRR